MSWAPLGVVFGRLGLLLGSFLAAPGVVLVLFRHFNSSIQPINSSTRRFKSSTHQPMALRHFRGTPGLRESALGGSKTLPRSSRFGPFFVLSFGIGFLVVLGSSWGRFWSSGAPLRVVFGRSEGRLGAFSAFQLIDSTHQLINSSIQRINSSTYQLIIPWPFGTFLPGPADCALRD